MKGNYDKLVLALSNALLRASAGKGKDRHADDNPFEKQPIVTELHAFKSPAPALFQIRKKALESTRLDLDRAQNEMLDVIVYAAAVWVYLNEIRYEPILTKPE